MYHIIISNSAEKDMERLPVSILKRVGKAIDLLSQQPRPPGCLKLKRTNENLWRIRLGDYRVIYLIDDPIQVIDVRKVGNRKDIYE